MGKTLSVVVEEDSGLYRRFDAFREQNDYASRSEALREVMRRGLSDRPDTAVAGLLFDARKDIHTFVAVALLALIFATVTTGIASVAGYVVAGLYGLTIFVGAADAIVLGSRLTTTTTDADSSGVEA